MIWCKRLGQSVSLYCMFMFIQTHSPTSACARSVACTVLSDDGVARLWNHLKEQVGLDTETHDEKQPEKDAISELSDHPPLRLRATEVECLECRWYLTSTRWWRPPRWHDPWSSFAALRRIFAMQTSQTADAAASSSGTLRVVADDAVLRDAGMWRRQLGHVGPCWGRLCGPALDNRRQRVGATVSVIVQPRIHAVAWQEVRRVEARCQPYRPLRTALWHVLLGVDIGNDDGHHKCDWHHDHCWREEHTWK